MCSLCVGCNLHLYTMRGFVAQVSLLGRTSQCNVTSIALFCAPLCVTFLFFISCTMYIYISLINFLIDCLFVYLPPFASKFCSPPPCQQQHPVAQQTSAISQSNFDIFQTTDLSPTDPTPSPSQHFHQLLHLHLTNPFSSS